VKVSLTCPGAHTEIGAENCEKSDGASVTPTKGKGRGRRPSISPIHPVADPQVGDIVWAKVKKSRWWPGKVSSEYFKLIRKRHETWFNSYLCW
jgi:hypothetical protein